MAIKDKVVVITGASSGIGEATAKTLAAKGAKVVLGARREDKLQAIVADIQAAGGTATFRVTDVTQRTDSQALIQLAKATYGKVDVLFLNAGLMPNSPLSALHVDEWDRMVDVNLKGVMYGIAAVLPDFTTQKHGQIIATSSVAGLKAYPGGAIYGATKWAVKDLMEVLRMESAQEKTHIRTTTIYPAAIQSELLETITDSATAKGAQSLYDAYEISPQRVADVVAYAVDQPEDTTVNEMTIGPATQSW